jgi:hypothetical protein
VVVVVTGFGSRRGKIGFYIGVFASDVIICGSATSGAFLLRSTLRGEKKKETIFFIELNFFLPWW